MITTNIKLRNAEYNISLYKDSSIASALTQMNAMIKLNKEITSTAQKAKPLLSFQKAIKNLIKMRVEYLAASFFDLDAVVMSEEDIAAVVDSLLVELVTE